MRKLDAHINAARGAATAAASSSSSSRITVSKPKRHDQPEVLLTGNEDADLLLGDGARNCIGCGFVYTAKRYDALDACPFCSRPVTSHSKKETRRRREEGQDFEALKKAEALRDRLVSRDMEARGISTRQGGVRDDDVIE